MKYKLILSIFLLAIIVSVCISCAKNDINDSFSPNIQDSPSEETNNFQSSSEAILPENPPENNESSSHIDTIAPTITGIDFEVFLHSTPDYLSQITVTDNEDPNPSVDVNTMAVLLDTIGTYPIIYTATDSAGNSTSLTIYVSVIEKDIPDTTPPVINAIIQSVMQYDSVDFTRLVSVLDNRDALPTLTYNADAVLLDTPGIYDITYIATDCAGNSSTYTLSLTVVFKDITPPVVSGSDFAITVGDTVSYKKQITVQDDSDPNPEIKVDNSSVLLDTPGTYPIIYTVPDASGNSTVFTIQLTIQKKDPVVGANEEYVLLQARKILDQITDESMSKLQVAYTIYRWTKNNIGYVDTSDKTNWVVGAYDGFKNRSGDCYTYFAVSKALLTAAGIETRDVVKNRTSSKQSMHYWLLVNVGDGWYHFDSTRYVYSSANFFMLTDAEISAWDAKYYKNAHGYLKDGLPEVATKSIQDRINYSSPNLKY